VRRRGLGLFAIAVSGAVLACSSTALLRRDISQGELLYRQKCRSCHNLVNPKKLSDEEWELQLETMGMKSKLSSGENQLIWEYLASHN